MRERDITRPGNSLSNAYVVILDPRVEETKEKKCGNKFCGRDGHKGGDILTAAFYVPLQILVERTGSAEEPLPSVC